MKFSYGWMVVAAVFISTGLTIGTSQYAFGVFVEPLESQFGWTRTQINASLSFAALSALVAPVVGHAMDRFGARLVIVVSLLILALSYLLRPFMTDLWHWYALSVLQFIAVPGATTLPAGRLVNIWFHRTRGRVFGLTIMGNNFGGLTIPPSASFVVGAAGWQWGYHVFAFLALFIAILALLIVREGSFPRDAEGSTQDLGNQSTWSSDKPSPMLQGIDVGVALRSRVFYTISGGILLATFTYSAVLPQIIPHLTNEGISMDQASLLLSALAGFGMIGKLLFGYLSEHISARYALIASLAGQMLGLLLIATSGASPLAWLAVPAFGLAFGGLGALIPLLVQETFGLRAFGGILGLVNMATVGSFVSGPIFVGLVFDLTGSYRPAFLIVAGLFLVGALVLSTARPLASPMREVPFRPYSV